MKQLESAAFRRALAERAPDPKGRRWLFVPYDQLSDQIGPLAREDPRQLGIVLVESTAKARRRPYHRQKLALVLANLRQFALEQAARGVAVRHVVTRGSYASALHPLAKELGPLRVQEPAERELRIDLAPLVRAKALTVLPHEGWLTTPDQFERSTRGGQPPWRMDAFYRLVRKETGILMDARGRPVGGKLSFDAENRRAWRGDPPAPTPLSFPDDPIKAEVCELIATRFADHPGALDPASLPSTAADAERLWRWAQENCLPQFGPFEDAMSTRSRGLFHTRVSALVNLGRLLPRQLVDDALALPIALASKEGFLRQVLGWREYVRHVHCATDGLREVAGARSPTTARPGDGGYARWRGQAWPSSGDADEPSPYGGAAPSHLDAHRPLPVAFWGTPSGLRCLDEVVRSVWEEGYSHHITRLMVLSNLATLLDVSPRELCDWFWCAYTDAYDWVVEPNVLGMGTFAVGPLFTTKPYISGAAYIAKMSDSCQGCAFDPKRDCPITHLYWDFLDRHRAALADNPRLKLVLASAAKRSPAAKARDRLVAETTWSRLLEGNPVRPSDVAP